MSTNINSTEQIVEINAGDQITNVNIVSQSTTQVISGEQVVTVDVNAGTIPAAWGSITGTLSNQTDLQNALNAKQNNITLTTTGTTGVATLVGATLNIPNYVSSTKQTQWDSAYNDKINSAEVSGTTTKTLTLTQQDGGIIQASWSDFDTAPVTSVFGRTGDVVATEGDYNINQLGDVTITSATNGQVLKYNGTAWVNAADASGLTSVGLAMPSAFTVSGSPLTSNGTITVTGAGTTSQYVRGDGSLAAFPSVSNEAKTLIREVYNKTGATLTKGTVVYIDGGQGNLPTVTKALAVGDPTSAQTFGIVQSDITNMNNGFVVVAGGIDNLDTQAYTEGTALYLSPTTAGAWTSTKPYAPQHIVYLGVVVRSHPTQGVIEVKIQNGYELDELHNVSARFPTNKDGLFYNSTSGVWENKSIAGVLGYTPVPESRIITINGTAQNLSADRTWSVGTVTSVSASGGTGISISGSPVTGSGTINITNTAPDQIVSLTGAGTTSISGTYPNFTVTSNDQYVGTVTSVNATVPTGFEVSGVPITSSGTVDIKFASGYSLPTNAKQTQWDDAYAKRINSLTVTGNSGSSTLVSNVLNVPTYTLAGLGGEPAITAGTTSQYFRGDKTFQTLDTSVVPENGNVYFTEPRVRATVLSGLNITGGSISASDSVLNAFGKVQNQINGLIGGSIFQSTWNASTNTPSLASGVGTKGYYYIVSVAGTTNLDGITDWQIGDWAIFDGTVWRKVDNTDAVVSVNGYTGVVNLVLDDLADVSAASPTDTQLLRFNGTTSKWYNWTPNYEPALTKGNLTEATSSVLTITGGSNAVIGSGTTIQVKQSSGSQSGFLSSTDWTTFNNKQNALTNPVTGTGTNNYVAKFNATGSTIANSQIFDDNTTVGINTSTASNTKLAIKADWVGGHSTVKVFPVTEMASGGLAGYGIFDSNGTTRRMYLAATNTEVQFNAEGEKPIIFYTNATTALTLTSTQQAQFANIVGINGSLEEGWALRVNGNTKTQSASGTTVLQINDTSTGGKAWSLISAGASNAHSVSAGSFYVRNSTDGNSPFIISGSGNATFLGSVTASIASLGSAATTFVVSDSGTLKSRTAAQTLSDIAALPLAGGTLTGALTLNYATPTIFLNDTGDESIEIGIRVNGEDFEIYEPEDTNKIWFKIRDTEEDGYLFGSRIWTGSNLTNPITGDGTETAGNIAYFTGNTSIAGESDFSYDAANNRLRINGNSWSETTDSKLVVSGYLSVGSGAVAQLNGFVRIKDQLIIHQSSNTANEANIQAVGSNILSVNPNGGILLVNTDTSTAANYKLQVAGDMIVRGGGDIVITPATSGANATLYNDIGNLIINNTTSINGSLRLGSTSAPSNAMLQVVGDWVSGHSTIKVQGSTADQTGIGWYNTAGTRKGVIAYRGTDFYIETQDATTPLALSTNGAVRVNIDGTNGYVAIGDFTAPVALAIQGNTTDKCSLQLKQTATGGRDYRISSRSDGTFRITDDTAAATRFTIAQNGRISVGTANTYDSFVISDNGGTGWEFGNSGTVITYNRTTSAYIPMQFTASKFSFATGDMGVGTSTTPTKLTVYQSSASTTTINSGITIGNGNGTTGCMAALRFGTYGDEAGSVNYPKQFIAGWRDANGGGFGDLILGNYKGSDSLGVASYSDTAIRIKKSGNVMIGTSSIDDIQPTYTDVKLQVQTHLYVGSTTSVPSLGRITINGQAGDWSYILMTNVGTAKYAMGYRDADGLFHIAPGAEISTNTGLNMNSSGRCNIGGNTFNGLLTLQGAHIGGYGLLNMESSDSCLISMNSSSTYDVRIRYKYQSVDKWYVGMSDNDTFKWQNASSVTRLSLTQAGALTAESFFETSDMRLKSNIQDYKSNDILNISAKIYEKDGKLEVGYIAQELQDILGSAISVRENGYLDLSYRQVHTAKIAALEDEIKQLKNKLNELGR